MEITHEQHFVDVRLELALGEAIAAADRHERKRCQIDFGGDPLGGALVAIAIGVKEVVAPAQSRVAADQIVDLAPYEQPPDGLWHGAALRILGPITAERVRLLQDADEIVQQEIRAAGLYRKLWQAFAVLLPVRSVGVLGDERAYGEPIAIRAVESADAMTADWSRLPYEVLAKMSTRIMNEIRGINRVVYDISQKPPSTIEWE